MTSKLDMRFCIPNVFFCNGCSGSLPAVSGLLPALTGRALAANILTNARGIWMHGIWEATESPELSSGGKGRKEGGSRGGGREGGREGEAGEVGGNEAGVPTSRPRG